MKNLNSKIENSFNKNPLMLIAILIFALTALVIPDLVLAQSSPFDSIDKAGGEVNDWLSGTFLAWMGTISLIIFGIALKFGKADWTKGIHIVGSILFIANAAGIVAWLISMAS